MFFSLVQIHLEVEKRRRPRTSVAAVFKPVHLEAVLATSSFFDRLAQLFMTDFVSGAGVM